MDPDSNQQSKTSGILCASPPHLHLIFTSSINGRCKSLILASPIFFSSSSFSEPMQIYFSHSLHCQRGIGAPQKRFLEIAQSRASESHFPNLPFLMCVGIQWIFSLFLTKS